MLMGGMVELKPGTKGSGIQCHLEPLRIGRDWQVVATKVLHTDQSPCVGL